MSKPRILVHGGAGLIDESRLPMCILGCEAAALVGQRHLRRGAVHAVVAAVKSLEEDPALNAGLGSTLTRDGTVELDAAVMTGDLRFGAVGACPPVASAIGLAQAVMDDGEYSFLVGDGAIAFAKEVGVEVLGPHDLTIERQRSKLDAERKRRGNGVVRPASGTVGAVAIDSSGSFAAATSTGGILYKRVGRVGDSPLIGAGTYADDEVGGAASATGHGEAILRAMLCRVAVEALGSGLDAVAAGKQAMAVFERRVSGEGGLILIDAKSRIFVGRNTMFMPWASTFEDGPVESGA